MVDVLAQPKSQIILPQTAKYATQQPIRSESRARLVEGIARGRYWLNQLTSGEVNDTREIANQWESTSGPTPAQSLLVSTRVSAGRRSLGISLRS